MEVHLPVPDSVASPSLSLPLSKAHPASGQHCQEEGKLAKSMWVLCGPRESGKEPVAEKEVRREVQRQNQSQDAGTCVAENAVMS